MKSHSAYPASHTNLTEPTFGCKPDTLKQIFSFLAIALGLTDLSTCLSLDQLRVKISLIEW